MKKKINVSNMSESCREVTEILKAIAHPQRLMLLCYLSSGEKTVGDLEELCSVSQSTASQFLTRMKLQGLVASEKRGLRVYYRIEDSKVLKLMTSLHDIYCR